ncbi:extracellular solute-binding protein [Lachnospiraceae bacterium OttesenSCG-928-D06]|nr:extracellular solute-binding protein [Lachnospiraceae bacterium OttesenSCG-928-D06]
MGKCFVPFLLCGLLLLSGCGQNNLQNPPSKAPELRIYTYQEESVYSPIIKEYQERTGILVEVINGSYKELKEYILADNLSQICDVVFGADAALFEQTPSSFSPYTSEEAGNISPIYSSKSGLWTGFSVRPIVIMYNTRVVTYREVPEGFHNLLDTKWKGQIAFMNPALDDVFAFTLTASMHTQAAQNDFVYKLAENINYTVFDSLSSLNQAISEGRNFLGVTTEEKAVSIKSERGDVNYIYPSEGVCLLVDGSAIAVGCENLSNAQNFIDFTASKDAQYFLTSTLGRRSIRDDVPPPASLDALLDISYTSISLGHQYEDAIKNWIEAMHLKPEEGR